MDCPYCERPTRVIRQNDEGGYVRLVRECTVPYGMEEAHGPRQFETVEMPASILPRMGSKSRLEQALAFYRRGVAKRRLAYSRKLAAFRLKSLSSRQLARVLGVSQQRACSLINERKERENGLRNLQAAGAPHGEDVPESA